MAAETAFWGLVGAFGAGLVLFVASMAPLVCPRLTARVVQWWMRPTHAPPPRGPRPTRRPAWARCLCLVLLAVAVATAFVVLGGHPPQQQQEQEKEAVGLRAASDGGSGWCREVVAERDGCQVEVARLRGHGQDLTTAVYQREERLALLRRHLSEYKKDAEEAWELLRWTLTQMKEQLHTCVVGQDSSAEAMEARPAADRSSSRADHEGGSGGVASQAPIPLSRTTESEAMRRWYQQERRELEDLKKEHFRTQMVNKRMRDRLRKLYGDSFDPEQLLSTSASPVPNAPEKLEVRPVIVWLGCRYDSLRWFEFVSSFRSVEEHFNRWYRYPILIFHEGDYGEEVQSFLRNISSAKVQFEPLVNLTQVPPRYRHLENDPAYQTSYPAYKNMCRFFSGEFFWHPATQRYSHYWRMDTDAFLFEPVGFDIFDFMQQNGIEYSSHTLDTDLPQFTVMLGETTKQFLRKHPAIKPKDLSQWFDENGNYNRRIYLNNFEVSSFRLWRSPSYRLFYDYLEASEGFWKYRWGDAPVHTLATGIFLQPEEKHLFDYVAYKHRLIDQRTTNKFNE